MHGSLLLYTSLHKKISKDKSSYAVPPAYSRLYGCVIHARAPRPDEWPPTASTLCPLSLPRIKVQVVSLCYAQNKHKAPLQRIPWLLVEISNATLIYFVYIAGSDERKKERKKICTILIFGRGRFAALK